MLVYVSTGAKVYVSTGAKVFPRMLGLGLVESSVQTSQMQMATT